jgi:hypothetical protein
MQTKERQIINHTRVFEDGEWWAGKDSQHGRVRADALNRRNVKRMYVAGKYVAQTHPLWKTGRYSSFNDAAFSSFPNYNKTTKGAVYVITNDAWDGWVKVGKAGDAEDRLKGYQTGDPHRSYMLKHYVTVDDRHTSEVKAHKALEALSEARQNEWFKVDLTTAIGCIEALHE